jgi:hypothetical protein
LNGRAGEVRGNELQVCADERRPWGAEAFGEGAYI